MRSRVLYTAPTVLLLVAITLGSALAASGYLPGGTEIEVTIDDPVTCTNFYIPIGGTTSDVNVLGVASVGEGVAIPNTTLIYVLDGSGSAATPAGGDCGPDQNPGDPEAAEDEIIDCEIAAAINLNNTAITLGSVAEVGMIMFAGDGVTADATPVGGDDPLINPAADGNSNGANDVDEVLHSIRVAYYVSEDSGFWEFAVKHTPDIYMTDFADAIGQALAVAAGATTENVIVVFLSDGQANAGDPVSAVLPGNGEVFHTFAVGPASSCNGDPTGRGSLQDIADLTGGTCTEIADPSDLPDILPELIVATLDQLEIEVDGGGTALIGNDDIDPDLPQLDPVTVWYDTWLYDLGPGDHDICVTASGSDAGGAGSLEECVTIHLIQLVGIDIKPDSYPNSINTKNKGTIPVGILSDPTFYAPDQVDTESLTFGVTGDENSLEFCSPGPEDVNGDGLLDLVCHFRTQDTGFVPGDEVGILKGLDMYGWPFQGSDSVRILH